MPAYANGVFWVSLAAVPSAEFLVSAIVDALQWTSQCQDDPREQLLRLLGSKQMLLVLDNFEHLLGAATLLTELLERAPDVQLLVTSRERLCLRWEWVFDIDGLAYPPGDQREALETYSAVQLFVERARQVRRQFALTGGEELAAATVRDRSCREIADQIETTLAVLATSLLDVPARHASMRAVFDHSWQLLAAEEQRVFRQVSVFRGGFQSDAAAAVTGASEPVLTALIEKSLLRRTEHPQGTWRNDLHEVVRQYAFERLQRAGEVEQTRDRHAGYVVMLAEEAEPQLAGAEQKLWLDRLEREHDNLRAALQWVLERGEAGMAARLGGALWRFWWMHGHLREGRAWLEQVLGMSQIGSPKAAWAKACHGAGVLADEQGDYAQARSFYEASLTLRRRLGDRQGMASSLNSMGVGAYYQGDYVRAQALFEESVALKWELGDRSGIAGSLANLAVARSAQGDYVQARALYEESLALFQELGDRSGIALTLANLGAVALDQHDPGAARPLFVESLALFQELGDQDGIAECLEGLAGVAGEHGRAAQAARLFGAASVLRESIGTPLTPIERARYDTIISAARAHLDEATWTAAWAAGQAMSLEQAIEEASQV
jgi:predicted ATPase